MRRDFTINAMALGEDGRIIDYCGGIEDLKAKKIRTVGDPRKRFEEDALRILRGLRFSAELGFSIEKETSKEIFRQKDALCHLSAERIWKEFSRLLCGAYCVPVLRKYFDVFAVFIPEIRPMKGFEQHNPHHIYDVWEHTLVSILSIRPELILRLTMLFHDIGKPDCFEMDEAGVGHFRGHMKISAEKADEILRRLKVDTQTRETTVLLIKAHKDLIALGIPAGPVIGKVKKQLLDEVIDGNLKNEKSALNARATGLWTDLKQQGSF